MHLCFDAAPAVVSAPSSPERAAEVFRRSQGLVARDRACRDGLPRLCILAGRDDCGGPAIGDGVMAFSGVVGAICGDTGDVLIGGDLGQQFGQHGGIPDVAAGDLDRPDLQRLFVDPEMDLAPDAAFCPAVLTRVPLTFPFDLDPGAVDQEMQRTLRAPVWDVHGKGLLAMAQCAEIRHIPVQSYKLQETFDEPSRLPERHAEKDLHRQAGLDCSLAVNGLSPTLAGWLRGPRHARIEPDRQRPAALERLVVRGPVQGLLSRCVRLAHAFQLSRWIHKMNPSRDLCNRAAPSLQLWTGILPPSPAQNRLPCIGPALLPLVQLTLPHFVDLLLTRPGGIKIPHKISLAGLCYYNVFWLREQDLNL